MLASIYNESVVLKTHVDIWKKGLNKYIYTIIMNSIVKNADDISSD